MICERYCGQTGRCLVADISNKRVNLIELEKVRVPQDGGFETIQQVVRNGLVDFFEEDPEEEELMDELDALKEFEAMDELFSISEEDDDDESKVPMLYGQDEEYISTEMIDDPHSKEMVIGNLGRALCGKHGLKVGVTFELDDVFGTDFITTSFWVRES